MYALLITTVRALMAAKLDSLALTVFRTGSWFGRLLRHPGAARDKAPAIYTFCSPGSLAGNSDRLDEYRVLYPACKLKVAGPKYFQEEPSHADFSQPEIYAAWVKSVTIVGGCKPVLFEDGLALLDEADRGDLYRYDLETELVPVVASGRLLITPRGPVQRVENAISLCGHGSQNYFHWLFDFVARLSLLKQLDSRYSNWPLLVDDRIRQTGPLLDILQHFAPGQEMIFVPHGQQVQLAQLLYLSPLSWAPFNLRPGERFRVEDSAVSPLAIDFVRATTPLTEVGGKPQRIFISRKNQPERRQIDEASLMEQLKPRGFVAVQPEEMSFREQAALFSGAEMVVAVTGAALANIVFCRPGAVVICLISGRLEVGIFSTIAEYLGVDMIYLAGDNPPEPDKIHQAFEIDPARLAQLLDSVDSGPVLKSLDGKG